MLADFDLSLLHMPSRRFYSNAKSPDKESHNFLANERHKKKEKKNKS